MLLCARGRWRLAQRLDAAPRRECAGGIRSSRRPSHPLHDHRYGPFVENFSTDLHVTAQNHSVKRLTNSASSLLSLNTCTSIWSAQRSGRRRSFSGTVLRLRQFARRFPTRRRCVERTTLRSPRAAAPLQVCEAHVEMPATSRPTRESRSPRVCQPVQPGVRRRRYCCRQSTIG